MKIKLTYEPTELSWIQSKTVETQDNLSHEDVQSLFQIELGIPYNMFECTYEVVGVGKIYTLKEILAHTE